MPTQRTYGCVRKVLVSTAYVCLILIGFAGCQGCYREVISPSSSEVASHLGGIPNVGNSCYVNATLQIIAKLYPDLFEHQSSDVAIAGQEIINKIKNDQDCVSQAEAEAFYDAFLNTHGGRGQFERDRQGDAEECFTFLSQNSTLHSHSTWQRIISRRGIAYNYGGWREDNNHNIGFLSVPLPASDNVTMQACLEYMFGDEELTGDNQYRDVHLGEGPVDATKCDRLEINSNSNTPLAIQLRRFTNNQSKITKAVTDTFHLTVPASIQYSYNKDVSDLHYHLQGFIVHISGNKTHLGHYIACIRQAGQWKLYNDEKVTNMTPDEAEKYAKQGYLYFYRRTS